MGTNPDMNLTGLSHQIVFSASSTNRSLLLTDGEGSQGKVHNITVLEEDCAAGCAGLDGATCYAQAVAQGLTCYTTNYVQVLGCSLRTSQETLSITQTGLLSSANSSVRDPPSPHSWTSFEWEDPDDNDDFLGKEFLTMLVPTTCAALGTVADANGLGSFTYREHDTAYMRDMLVNGLMTNGSTLQNMEDMLELLSASYLWNVAQQCQSPPFGTTYEQCNSTAINANPERLNAAVLVSTEAKARLAIVRWKAVVTAICSIVLFVLSLALLGMSTDLPKDQSLRQLRFIESAKLMKDSKVPAIVEMPRAKTTIRLRYVSGCNHSYISVNLARRYAERPTGDGYSLDVADR